MAAVADQVAKAVALEKLHDHERQPVDFPKIEDADHVLMAEVSGHARFLEKTVLHFRVAGAFRRQDLHGDGSADHRIGGPIDLRHPAAEKLDQFIFAEPGGEVHFTSRR